MLSITHLNKTYSNGVKALVDVSLDIPTGMFGLLGPNGAGKSSLMRTIATLQPPDSGSVICDDIDVLKTPDRLREQLGYLPQDFGTYPRITPLELLDHLAVLKGVGSANHRRAAVEQLLVQTNLWEVRKRRIDSFSGGMRQRFGIAQALLGNPRLIIVDEPTAGLDPTERRRFHNLLAHIGEQVIVILSTHIVDDVADLCPRMAIIGAGRVLLTGDPTQLLATLQGRLWTRVGDEKEQTGFSSTGSLISSRLAAGRRWLRVRADARPDAGFAAVDATLEDVYFATLVDNNIAESAS